jgi:hypothetical protein
LCEPKKPGKDKETPDQARIKYRKKLLALFAQIVKNKMSVFTGVSKDVSFNSNYRTMKTAMFRKRHSLISPVTSKLSDKLGGSLKMRLSKKKAKSILV